MTNISHKNTEGKDYKNAYKELENLIAKLDQKKASYFINGLLTEAEQIMLVKRFAAFLMFSQNYSPYRVSQTISISISTAQRLVDQYQNNDFSILINRVTPKQKNKFILLVQDLIMAKVNTKARSRLLKRTY